MNRRVWCRCCCMPFSTILVVISCSPGLESSVLVSSWQVSSISSQVSKRWSEQCSWTSEEHPADPFHSLDNLKNQFVSVSLCRGSRVWCTLHGCVSHEWRFKHGGRGIHCTASCYSQPSHSTYIILNTSIQQFFSASYVNETVTSQI